MLSNELQSIRNALGDVLGSLPADKAEIVRIARRNLDAAASQADELERRLVPATPATAPVAAQGVA